MTALANKSISRQPGPAAHSWCSPARRCELGVFRHVRILCNAGPESADQCTLCLFWARLHSVLSVSSFYQAHAKLARPVWRSLAQLPATQYRERREDCSNLRRVRHAQTTFTPHIGHNQLITDKCGDNETLIKPFLIHIQFRWGKYCKIDRSIVCDNLNIPN